MALIVNLPQTRVNPGTEPQLRSPLDLSGQPVGEFRGHCLDYELSLPTVGLEQSC